MENQTATFLAAVNAGVDMIELDVQEVEGQLWVHHDPLDPARWPDPPPPRYAEVLDLLAGRVPVHIDVKHDPTPAQASAALADPAMLGHSMESRVLDLAWESLGPEGFVAASFSDRAVRLMTAWRDQDPQRAGVRIGLTIGRDNRERRMLDRLRLRMVDYFPEQRLEETGADLLVPRQDIARRRLIRVADRRGIPVMVWTVNDSTDLRRLLRDDRVTAVISDYPLRTLSMREVGGPRRRSRSRVPASRLPSSRS